MNNEQFMKWFIEVANQEYDGDLKIFEKNMEVK